MRALLISLSRWRACRRGATAVEFAFVAPILLPLLIVIMGYGILFFVMSVVQYESKNQAVQIASTSKVSDIKTAICNAAYQMLDCSKTGFFIEVAPVDPAGAGVADPTADKFVYQTGQVHALRLVYPFSLPVPEQYIPPMALRSTILFYGK